MHRDHGCISCTDCIAESHWRHPGGEYISSTFLWVVCCVDVACVCAVIHACAIEWVCRLVYLCVVRYSAALAIHAAVDPRDRPERHGVNFGLNTWTPGYTATTKKNPREIENQTGILRTHVGSNIEWYDRAEFIHVVHCLLWPRSSSCLLTPRLVCQKLFAMIRIEFFRNVFGASNLVAIH